MPVALEVAPGGFEDRLVLRVPSDQGCGDLLQTGQRLPRPVLPPRLDQEAAGLVAGWIEQSATYAVLRRYSQRSRSVHALQSGLRATQT